MSLAALMDELVSQVSLRAFLCQAVTILILTVYGYLLLCALNRTGKFVRRALFAYPAGLAAFCVVAFLLSVTSIPYTRVSVLAGLVLSLVLAWVLVPAGERKDALSAITDISPKEAVVWLLILLLATGLSCSGILRVTLSNDSAYNYSFYPSLIVHFRGLRENFNTFLTDVGQGVALINTLPFLFGFEETFGIQHMLNMVFLGTFWTALFEAAASCDKKVRVLFACTGTALLLFSMPYLLLSKWVLANDYFAVYMFLCAYLACRGFPEQEGRRRGDERTLLYLFVPALSILRIEGGVFAVFFILCISVLDLKNRELCGMLLPSVFLQALYAGRIFLTMSIIAPYRFLTEEKALVMLLLMVLGVVYLLLIRGRFCLRVQKHLGVWILAGLIVINLLLCIRDVSVYLENLRSFATNLFYTGGWGIFPVTVVSIYLLSLNRRFRPNCFDLLSFSYLFYALAVSFMREGGMQSGVGDSGNRVLMQVVPVALFAALTHVADLLGRQEK